MTIGKYGSSPPVLVLDQHKGTFEHLPQSSRSLVCALFLPLIILTLQRIPSIDKIWRRGAATEMAIAKSEATIRGSSSPMNIVTDISGALLVRIPRLSMSRQLMLELQRMPWNQQLGLQLSFSINSKESYMLR